jgi:hypothetical protein
MEASLRFAESLRVCISRRQKWIAYREFLSWVGVAVIRGDPGDPRETEYSKLDRRMKDLIDDFGLTKADEFEHGIKYLMAEKDNWLGEWLWIDALCIDQSDARERTHQVGIMSEIFGRADRVISWLGPAYDNSEHAMNTIAAYASDQSPNKTHTLSQAELSEAICSLCERSYWKRLWVFQELRHANDIILMCGAQSMPWDHFRQLWRAMVDIATTDEGRSDRLWQSLATRMMTLRLKPMNFSLWNLLKETQNLECADQRDRIYALLSVATEGHEGIEPDYDSSATPLDLAHRTLQNKHALRVARTLDEVAVDCEFLKSVFRLKKGCMLR